MLEFSSFENLVRSFIYFSFRFARKGFLESQYEVGIQAFSALRLETNPFGARSSYFGEVINEWQF